MLSASIRTATLALAAGGLTLATPVSALPGLHGADRSAATEIYGQTTYDHYRDRWERRDDRRHARWDRNDRRYDTYGSARYDDRYRNQQTWRGADGRQYCRKSDGTTGLIIGGAAGALLGREIDSRGDRTLGTILGAAGGALLGKSIDSKTRCR